MSSVITVLVEQMGKEKYYHLSFYEGKGKVSARIISVFVCLSFMPFCLYVCLSMPVCLLLFDFVWFVGVLSSEIDLVSVLVISVTVNIISWPTSVSNTVNTGGDKHPWPILSLDTALDNTSRLKRSVFVYLYMWHCEHHTPAHLRVQHSKYWRCQAPLTDSVFRYCTGQTQASTGDQMSTMPHHPTSVKLMSLCKPEVLSFQRLEHPPIFRLSLLPRLLSVL